MALGARELLDEVLVDAAEDIARLLGVGAEADPGDRRDELAERLRGDRGAGVDLRQHVLQCSVLALDQAERRVELDAEVWLGAEREQRIPARLLGDPEDVDDLVGVAVFQDLRAFSVVVGGPLALRVARECVQRLAACLEAVGDVLEEDEAEDEVLVLRGLDAAAEVVGGVEEELLGGDVGGAGRRSPWWHPGKSACAGGPDAARGDKGAALFAAAPESFSPRARLSACVRPGCSRGSRARGDHGSMY
ncbi:MAG: hypothetical protein WKF94_17245 [Solirubrobacteraceae bacterium]